MTKKIIGYILIALGVVGAVVFLTADATGLGSGNGIGYRQIIGAVVGLVIALIGIWLALSKTNKKM